jgi:hypothetical protein
MAYIIKLKHGNEADWIALDPVLEAGEAAVSIDKNNFKVGDGTTAWSSLAYYVTGSLPYTPESISNKRTSWQVSPDNTAYPSEKLVKDNLDTKEATANRVTAFQVTPDNTHYPTEKLVKDSLDAKQATLVSASNIKTINSSTILGSGDLVVSVDPSALSGYVKFTGSTSGLNLTGYDITANIGRFLTITITSSGAITNLNADLLDGLQGSTYSTTAHTHTNYVPYTGGSSALNLTGYDITGKVGHFDTITITSTGKITNLNAEILNDIVASSYSTTGHTHTTYVTTAQITGYVPFSGGTSALNLTGYDITGKIGHFDTITVTSSGLINNLNAKYLNGLESSSFLNSDVLTAYVKFTGSASSLNLTGYDLTANIGHFESITVTSTGKITNLNSEYLSGYDISVFSLTGHTHPTYATTAQLTSYATTAQLTSYATTASITGFIPYTGAVSAVDLSGQSLTTTSTGIFGAIKMTTSPTSGYVLTSSDASGNTVWAANSASVTANRTDTQFATSAGTGTWTKPTSFTPAFVLVRMWGAGGGGGGGASRVTGTAIKGGAGGGGGAYVEKLFRASDLGSTENFTVGTGGLSGTAGLSAAGGDGGNGGDTSFGTTPMLYAYGGGGGAGGAFSGASVGGGGGGGTGSAGGAGVTTTPGSGGKPGTGDDTGMSGGTGSKGSLQSGTTWTHYAEYGGGGGGGGWSTNLANVGGSSLYGGAGGGCGGGHNSTLGASAAAAGGNVNTVVCGGGGSAGTLTPNDSGGNGGDGANGTDYKGGQGGGGGGAADAVAGKTGGNGGNGGTHGGGGGGGGAGNYNAGAGTGGTGGSGGCGAIYIFTW